MDHANRMMVNTHSVFLLVHFHSIFHIVKFRDSHFWVSKVQYISLLQALVLQNFALVSIIKFNFKFTLVDFWNKY